MKRRVLAIIQARMGSSRLPGKVLKPLCGKPILYHILQRVERVNELSEIVVATTGNQIDNPIAELAQSQGVFCFRGSQEDVLDRFFQSAQTLDAKSDDVIIRLTGDNPFIDPQICGELLSFFLESSFGYVTTSGYPLGVGTEIFTFSALEETHTQAAKAYEREHVTPFMYRQGQVFGTMKSPMDYSNVRLTVDSSEDYQVAQQIYASLYPVKKEFGLAEILDYLEANPAVAAINQGVHQKQLGE